MNDQDKKHINVNIQGPIMYSDAAFVSSNQHGVVLDFAQNAGPNQQNVVARVGMSHSHAKALLNVLQKHLGDTETVVKNSKVLARA